MEANLISCQGVWFVILILIFKENRKKKNYSILPKKWHNNTKKTCGCRSCYACKKIWWKIELSIKTTCQNKAKCVKFLNISKFFGAKDPFKKDVV